MNKTQIAPTTLTIYDLETKTILTEVPVGAEYITPSSVFVGTLEEFLLENPDYTMDQL